jgi:hypothetical protein
MLGNVKLAILIGVVSLVLIASGFVFRPRDDSDGSRRHNTVTALVFALGVALLTITIFLLLAKTFESSFGYFPFRLLRPWGLLTPAM